MCCQEVVHWTDLSDLIDQLSLIECHIIKKAGPDAESVAVIRRTIDVVMQTVAHSLHRSFHLL
jgi:hypothetical protein